MSAVLQVSAPTERRGVERRLTGWRRRTGWHPGSVERRRLVDRRQAAR